ncbi:acyl-CoA dehydrogenase [Salinisphaera sp. Q1T1-3]|uniref:acyl-CoA dehydrogenase n=1 Tax=Salinisphaera sp. Q1T1-3 TaxID=2321229 RepID=UPI000E7482A6|nr:acyl-CoA dehydrogenase [Salinisphaera sp. Q1T1-3]RJS95100.1 acyl-CoA dehydrogenase [Salinisphaera sp. Q1T1-3]
MFASTLRYIKKAQLLPRISDTERQALEAGSVWIDGEFFSGNPDFRSMMAQAYPALPENEQAFLDGPVEELLHRVDRWQLHNTRRIPDDIWQFLRENGFFGLIIPKEYGGSGFSTLGRSSVMMKTSQLGPIGTLIVIPNTLGAAELLIGYGTGAQKSQYLPRLASGELVPCFGLTEPTAGSDAASIKAEGRVFRDTDGELKIRLNFSKRYITLAPVANLVSLACQLHDPDNLLGKGELPGITVVLLEKGTPGLSLGDHHLPISAFDNGPIHGRDVVASVDQIIGGPEMAGQGWRMLMEQLGGGRAVSLPAGGVASAKASAAAMGPYSMVREQFGIPVGLMEGVAARIARTAALAYVLESSRIYVCAGVDAGHHPPVISAILKQQTTELGQQCLIDGMDVMAGAGVMQGPNNILGSGYIGAPVSVTVEGANILTRTLMIFGQGAVRCHPYALPTLEAVQADDVAAFRKAIVGWLGHSMANFGRGVVRGITRGATVSSPVGGETAVYFKKLGWAASRFAFLTDLAMFCVGGKLKQRGKLSGRFADALSWMVFATTTLRRFHAEGARKEDLPLVHWALKHSLFEIQQAFDGIYANFGGPVVGWLLRYPGRFWLRINPLSSGPTDAEDRAAAATVQAPGEQYQRVALGGLGAPRDSEPGMGRLLHAWRLVAAAQAPTAKIKKALRKGDLVAPDVIAAIPAAVEANIVTDDEGARVREAETARLSAVQVDVFDKDDYYRDTLAAIQAKTDTAPAAVDDADGAPALARAAND